MENIPITTLTDKVRDFLAMEPSVYKNILFTRDFNGMHQMQSNICKKEGCVYYSHVMSRVKKSKSSYYLHQIRKSGFTMDEKGKIQFWFGSNVYSMTELPAIIKSFNIDWFDAKWVPYVTKTILEKLLTFKVTNPVDFFAAVIKAQRIKASPMILYRGVKAECFTKHQLTAAAIVAANIDHWIEYKVKHTSGSNGSTFDFGDVEYNGIYFIIEDMLIQASQLDRKIDFTWSVRRMKEEHTNWTRELMEVEGENMENEIVGSLEKFKPFTPDGFTLLDTQKQVFFEGKLMNHCVYTNYWTNIRNGNYMAYHIERGGETATLGLVLMGNEIKFSQMYGYKNSSVSTKLREYVDTWVDELNTSCRALNIIHGEITVDCLNPNQFEPVEVAFAA